MVCSISFFTPIRFGEQKTFKQHFQEGIDDYFYLGGKSVFVISREIIDDSQAVRVIKNQDQSRVKQVILGVIKVISYMTVIIPLIVLIAKASFRLTHKFHIVSEDEYESIVSQKNFSIVEKASFWEFFLFSYNKAVDDDKWNSVQGLSFLIAEFQEIQRSLSNLLVEIKNEHAEYPEKKEALKNHISKLIDRTTNSLKELQEKIQDKTVIKGLANVGNTCYINSALQSLLAVRNFAQIIPDSAAPEPKDSFEARTKILASFKSFFQSWTNKETTTNLGHKVGALRREIFEAGLLEGGFIDRDQERNFQDAGQFFELILHVLGEGFQLEITRVPVKDDGESIEASRKVETTPQGVFYLQLPGALLQDIVNGYQTALDGELSSDDKWRVEIEGSNSQSEIFVSRYKEMQKIVGSASEILVVRVDNHVVKPEQDQIIDFTALFKKPSENCNYKLVGFSQNHHQIHWTSVVWKQGNWHYCNDSETKPISTEDPLFKHPANYMIFQKQELERDTGL
ncbi:hypothetical protein [Candidatus Rhabdochlamydia porcellionis]|jgi:hypothetical protein|uniref:ubiquitinyl hydrolase 1 n=1 Tax=Candidatus Rhabdochlamydia porcellionis TaxID=225148 RepID=A0ABX8YYZ5_9BACT|nr:hypothetical protein [Candidatus Rhabdochlamydia porcellionis]QZA58560.1 Ubiquitin carboxyl-terminal hydrolase [Candidatus Rhabdochlamydia porcellionis]